VPPPSPTLLDFVQRAGIAVYGVGKIGDIFVGRGLTDYRYSRSNDDGVDVTLDYLGRPGPMLVFTNLVDFDSKYGHRNDAPGYATCVEAFDRRIPQLRTAVGGGLMFVTGDHGCDPTTLASTDHTREHTPVLVSGVRRSDVVDLGTRAPLGALGATIADVLGIPTEGLAGESFAPELGG
jgi:phosphopentomutase